MAKTTATTTKNRTRVKVTAPDADETTGNALAVPSPPDPAANTVGITDPGTTLGTTGVNPGITDPGSTLNT